MSSRLDSALHGNAASEQRQGMQRSAFQGRVTAPGLGTYRGLTRATPCRVPSNAAPSKFIFQPETWHLLLPPPVAQSSALSLLSLSFTISSYTQTADCGQRRASHAAGGPWFMTARRAQCPLSGSLKGRLSPSDGCLFFLLLDS